VGRIASPAAVVAGFAEGSWERCDAVVFLSNPGAQRSMWCHSELVMAIELRKHVYSLDLFPDIGPHPCSGRFRGLNSRPLAAQRHGGCRCTRILTQPSAPAPERYPGLNGCSTPRASQSPAAAPNPAWAALRP
jgi:hypothetical protein